MHRVANLSTRSNELPPPHPTENAPYKQVRIAASPSRRATTVTFLWKDVQTLLRGSGISPKEFNRLVVDAYEQIEAKGFAPDLPISKQVWAALQARFQR